MRMAAITAKKTSHTFELQSQSNSYPLPCFYIEADSKENVTGNTSLPLNFGIMRLCARFLLLIQVSTGKVAKEVGSTLDASSKEDITKDDDEAVGECGVGCPCSKQLFGCPQCIIAPSTMKKTNLF